MGTLNRRDFVKLASTVGVTALAGVGYAVEPRKRPPNLIVMMADDLGAGELGSYGHPEHQTPVLDELARTGVRFETCYACPICHPSRFEIMTGQYGHNNNVYNFPGRRGGPVGGSQEDNIALKRTFGHVLKESGYATALVGKWQLSGEIPTLVHEAGFDEYCMWAYKQNLPEGVEHAGGWEGRKGGKTSRYWHPSIVANGKHIPTGPDDYGPDIFADFAIEFMKRHRDRPFLVYFPMALTHSPYYSTPDTTKGPADRFKHRKENWRANVEYCDKIVGRVLKGLEQVGVRGNTVVFFTGDNGTGGHGKAQPTELGARVPMIVNGPGIVKATGSSRALVDLADVLPTLCTLAGVSIPDDRPIDGKSFAHVLTETPGRDREWIYSYIGDRRILRDKRWLWEDNSPLHAGRFYDCGDCRDGSAYKEVTASTDPEVQAARKRFEALLTGLPVPILDYEGPAAELNSKTEKRLKKTAAWDNKHLSNPTLWVKPADVQSIAADDTGLRLTLRPGQKRVLAVCSETFRLPKGATRAQLTIPELTPGAELMFKLAGLRNVGKKSQTYAAHASFGLKDTGTIDIPLDPKVLKEPTTAWTLKFAITGKPGGTLLVKGVTFVKD